MFAQNTSQDTREVKNGQTSKLQQETVMWIDCNCVYENKPRDSREAIFSIGFGSFLEFSFTNNFNTSMANSAYGWNLGTNQLIHMISFSSQRACMCVRVSKRFSWSKFQSCPCELAKGNQQIIVSKTPIVGIHLSCVIQVAPCLVKVQCFGGVSAILCSSLPASVMVFVGVSSQGHVVRLHFF